MKGIKQRWNDLVVGNPMLIEVHRFRRKFLRWNPSNPGQSGVMVLIWICYAMLIAMVLQAKSDLSPMVLVFLQMVLLTLAMPVMLYNSIAGEREKRTWDILLVAPVTKGQIVVGKFMAGMAAAAAISVACLIPMVIAMIQYQKIPWQALVQAEAVILSFAAMLAAWTVLVSARVRRGLMALGASLGSVLVALVVFPAFVATAAGGVESQFLLFLHPFTFLGDLGQRSENPLISNSSYIAPNYLLGVPHVFVYLFLTVVFVEWAIQTLNFAENDVKFLPKAKSNA